MRKEWMELLKKKHTLLDVGCHSGTRVNKMKEYCNAKGIDINTSNFSKYGKEVESRLSYGDITKTFTEEKFDWILLRDVLEHIEEDELALKNINKSMKINGYFVLSTPRHIPFFNYYDPAWVKWKFGGEMHYHYKKNEIKTILNENGFEIISIYLEGSFKWLINRWMNIFRKYILKSNKQIISSWTEGHFNWVILCKKEDEVI